MIQGICDPRFEAVRAAFENNFEQGLDVGASVAATIDGELVVDLWGGTADVAGSAPWERDTLVNVWSTTKTMLALCALLLADRGELDLHAPVARYWPEFAASGKADIEVRHLLSHTSGLSGWQEPMTMDDLYDWEKCCSLLAAQAPWWEAGTASGYHAITEGYLVGEVVRRIAGVSLGTFFATEFAEPLGADFHIGTGPELDSRIVSVIAPPDAMGVVEPGSIAARTLGNPVLDAHTSFTIPWRRAEIPAANGHGNARSVAQLQSIISNSGTVGGKTFLSSAGVEALFEVQSDGIDLVLGIPATFGMGFGLNSEATPISPNARACFWGGWGGSMVVNDLDSRMTFAYMMNKMGAGTTGDLRGASLLMSMYAAMATA
jgi:CubicO group peptidase (beta-lactamase class C family)